MKTNNTNPDSSVVVSYYLQAVNEGSRETVTSIVAKGFPSPLSLPLTARLSLS